MTKKARLLGHFDQLDSGVMRGWAAASKEGGLSTVDLVVSIDGKEVHRFTPNMYREDLKNAGIGDGEFGFVISLSEVLPIGTVGRIAIKDANGNLLDGMESLQVEKISYESRPNKNKQSAQPRLSELILYERVHSEPAINQRLAIYVTFTRSGYLFRHHEQQVSELQAAGFWVLVVHVPGDQVDIDMLPILGNATMVKSNVGYDFGSWWVGCKWLEKKFPSQLENASALIIANDSYFGTVSASNVEEMVESKSDLSGICDSYDHGHHFQSFFVCASGSYLRSGTFVESILSYEFPSEKKDVIKLGEVLLSSTARDHGAKMTAICSYEKLRDQWLKDLPSKIKTEKNIYKDLGFHSNEVEAKVETSFYDYFTRLQRGDLINPTHLFWEEIMNSGVNIIKRELIFTDPVQIPGRLTRMRRLFDSNLISRCDYQQFADREKIQPLPVRI